MLTTPVLILHALERAGQSLFCGPLARGHKSRRSNLVCARVFPSFRNSRANGRCLDRLPLALVDKLLNGAEHRDLVNADVAVFQCNRS
jgi:hypothetical protein